MRFRRRIPVGPADVIVLRFRLGRSTPWLRLPRFTFSINTEAR